MIRATLETEKVQQMEEGELHKWLEGKGFNLRKHIDRIEGRGGLSVPEGTTLFWQPSPPGAAFKLRLFTPELREMGVLDPPSPTDPNFEDYER